MTLLAASFALACGGDSGTEPEVPVPATVTISGGPITLNQIGATATIAATVLDQNGTAIASPTLNYGSSSTIVASVSSSGVVTARGEGSATITVSSGTASADVSVTVTVSSVEVGEPVPNLAGASGSQRVLTLQVPAGTPGVLEIGTSGGTGDVDIIVRFGSAPAGSAFDCASVLDGNREFCTFKDPQPGTWFVLLGGFTDYAGVSLTARFRPLVTLQDGIAVAGLGTSAGEVLYFDFVVPGTGVSSLGGSPYADSNQVILGRTSPDRAWNELHERALERVSSGSASPDPQAGAASLRARTFGGTGVVGVLGTTQETVTLTPKAGEAPECVSQGAGTQEECVVPSPAPGDWQFALVALTTFSGVSFEVDFIPGDTGGPSGTITIQKAIQSSTGGVADNPAAPDLAGFQFQARTGGTTNVIGSATTTSAGTAVITVPQGTYDLVESDSQGLTDFTASMNGITVTTDENVNVDWVNRQAPPSSGNQDPVAILNASPESVPSGDGNSTVVTLYAGNSSDPDGDGLGFTWTVPNGTFVLGTNATSTTAKVTFPGNSAYPVTLTASDGLGGSTQAQTTIALGSALPAPGAFNIEMVNLATPSAAVQNALNAAAATWESVIRGNLIGIDFASQPVEEDDCIDGQPAFSGTIDDLRIYVDISPDDGPGGTLGSAGPCYTRGVGGTTIIGSMNFDSDDLNSLSPSRLSSVILHEMGHVLGIGTLWRSNALLLNPTCVFDPDAGDDGEVVCQSPGPDTRYVGAAGVAAWRALGGSDTTGAPVENGDGVSAGEGTLDGHWREIVFQTELMTGFVASSGANPLSQLTLAALLDLGYTIDFSQADDYAVPNLIASPALAEGVGDHFDLGDDIRRGTVWAVDDQGRVIRSFRIGR